MKYRAQVPSALTRMMYRLNRELSLHCVCRIACMFPIWTTIVIAIWASGPYYKTLVHIRVNIINDKTCKYLNYLT